MNWLRREIWLAALLLVAAVWAVWFQTGGFEYIRLDDNLFVFEFPAVAGGLSVEGIRGVFSNFTQGGIWMPLTSITYMVDISLFGATSGAHHLASVGWHTANTLLVFALLLRLSRRWMCARQGEALPVFACMLATFFWALHPLRNESVAWIASRKDLVFSFFTLLGLHAWLLQGVAGRVLGLLCCALACLSKPTAMVFPFVALVVELLDADEDTPFVVRLRRVGWWWYAPLLAMAVATGIIAIYSQTHVTGIDFGVRGLNEGYGSFAWRCLNAAVALGLYVAQTVVPVGIHVMYRSIVDGAPQGLWVGLAVLAAAACALFLLIRNRKAALPPLMAVAWFLVAIGPTLGVAGGFGNQARADRFLYLPAIGFSLLAAWGISRLRAQRIWRFVGVVLVAGYAFATWWNARTYATDYALFARVLEWDDRHDLALAHVGADLCARYGMPDEGIECFRRAMAVNPKAEDTASQLVFALATRGRAEDHGEIRQYCSKLLDNPELDEKGLATEALGMVAMKEMKWDEAIRFFNASVHAPKRRLPPDTAMIRLGMCYHNKGDLGRAERAFAYLAHSATDEKVKARSQQALQDIWKRKGTQKQ